MLLGVELRVTDCVSATCWVVVVQAALAASSAAPQTTSAACRAVRSKLALRAEDVHRAIVR
jgi:hypothetical protein